MFSKTDLEYLESLPFKIEQANQHDVKLNSLSTGHDWIIMSNYATPGCIVLHRHSRNDSFHRQKGSYDSMQDALKYIIEHERWFYKNKLRKGSMK